MTFLAKYRLVIASRPPLPWGYESENFNWHVKQHHDGTTVVYACWSCGFTAPVGKRYPGKIVTQHCVVSPRSSKCGRCGQIISGRSCSQRPPQRHIRRQNAGHDPVPERAHVAPRRHAERIIDSSYSEDEPLDRHQGEHEVTAGVTSSQTGPGTDATTPPAVRKDGASGSTPFSWPTAEDTAMQQNINSAAARVMDGLASPRWAERDDAARAPSETAAGGAWWYPSVRH
ncbi:unnamed protein product [Arctia plantaginis]|uniref:Uncharacterized protein n=1 Tax=Arctia plantaginis TaxID=874455 RepID=A0A8S0ZJQ6_ARCPL|nr:unnamed protein product [Arctia plantaginis]